MARQRKIPDPEEQQHIPGTEPTKNRKVHPKAMAYVRYRNARIAANKDEKESHDTLLNAMLEEGLTDYEYGGITVHIDDKKKVKVSGGDVAEKDEGDD